MHRIRLIIKYIMGMSLFFLIYHAINYTLENKESYDKFSSFYKSNENYDVLFIGNSHIMYSVFPIQLAKDYGIWSYNISVGGGTMPINYWMIMNSLDYTNPKILVIDCNQIRYNHKTDGAKYFHAYLDALPLSVNKVKMLLDLKNDQYALEPNDYNVLEYLWTSYVYHSRWKDMTKNDFKLNGNFVGRGGLVSVSNLFKDIEQIENVTEEAYTEKQFKIDETTGTLYLRKIIKECRKRNIEVLLTYLPGNKHNSADQKECKMIKELADEYNVNYIDFINSDIYNELTDYLSDTDHLNIRGSRKITDYLGKYIRNNYDVSYSIYDSFEDEYREYLDLEKYLLDESKQFEQDLLILLDKKYNLMIKFDNKILFEDKYYKSIFEDVGVDFDSINDNNILIIEKGGENTYFCKLDENIDCKNDSSVVNDFLKISNYYNFKNSSGNITIMSLYADSNDFVNISNYYENSNDVKLSYIE